MMKKILSTILVLVMVVCALPFPAVVAADDDLQLQDIDYNELVGRLNQADAGFTRSSRTIMSNRLDESSSLPADNYGYQFYYIDLRRWSSNNGGQDGDIDQWFLDYLDRTLADLRNNGGGCIIRGTYASGGEKNAEPSTFMQLQRHQKQLSKVFSKYADIIVAIECGMAGAYGEMHSGLYSAEDYKGQILDTWLTNLPDQITVNVRTSDEYRYYINNSDVYFNKYRGKTINGIKYPNMLAEFNYDKFPFPEGEIFNRIGLYNDAMIQDGNDGGTFSGGRDHYVAWMNGRSSLISYGGEFSGDKQYRYLSNIWLPLRAIPEFYQTHLSYYHGGNNAYAVTGQFKYEFTQTANYDDEAAAAAAAKTVKGWYDTFGSGMTYKIEQNGNTVDYTTGGWSNAIVNDDLIAAIGKATDLTADITAYKDRTVAEYFEDHVGYRIVLKSSYLSKNVDKGGVLTVKGSVDNTGFADISREKVTEVVLTNGENTYVTRTKIDANSWVSGSRSEYSAQLKLPANIPAGEYTVYLRVAGESNTGETNVNGCIRFANPGEFTYNVLASDYSVFASKVDIIYNKDIGGNYIGTFTVTDNTVKGADNTFKEVTTSFKDVESHWGKMPITAVCSLGLMSGTGGGAFAPEETTSRGMLAQVLYNLEGRPDISGLTNPFKDVKAGQWYTDAVIWAYHNKIVFGVNDDKFAPDQDLAREEFAALLYRYANYKKLDTSEQADLSKFGDADRIESYAKPAISWANAKGLITGHADSGLLTPKGKATRAEMASILYRFINFAYTDTAGE
ncbi:MAG: DUF4832 domain-containing protein [Clostridiales bacterium]|nr:DUF4832 domain-containing protein [Clostridiales bacterium]